MLRATFELTSPPTPVREKCYALGPCERNYVISVLSGISPLTRSEDVTRNIINGRSLIVRAHLIHNFKEECPLTSRPLVRGGFRILRLFNAFPNSICDMSRGKGAEKSSKTPKELHNTQN